MAGLRTPARFFNFLHEASIALLAMVFLPIAENKSGHGCSRLNTDKK